MYVPKRLPITLESTTAFAVQGYLMETMTFAVARSTDGKIGVTWNDGAHPGGYPKAFGNQQWFIMPDPLALAVAVAAEMLNALNVQ